MKRVHFKIVLILTASIFGLTACEDKSTDASKETSVPSQTQSKSAAEKVYGQLDGKDNGRLKP